MYNQHMTKRNTPRKKFILTATTFDRKGKILSTSQNLYNKTHPLQKYFSLKAGDSEFKSCQHAEFAAIIKAKNKQIYSIFVQRFSADGSPALAKPCRSCQEAIKAFGIKLVNYTTKEGVLSYEVE